jgi:hypothetical protein
MNSRDVRIVCPRPFYNIYFNYNYKMKVKVKVTYTPRTGYEDPDGE